MAIRWWPRIKPCGTEGEGGTFQFNPEDSLLQIQDLVMVSPQKMKGFVPFQVLSWERAPQQVIPLTLSL
jgi:hypothetical protein